MEKQFVVTRQKVLDAIGEAYVMGCERGEHMAKWKQMPAGTLSEPSDPKRFHAIADKCCEREVAG